MVAKQKNKNDYTLRYTDVARELGVDVRTVKRYVSEKKPYALTSRELWVPDGGGGQSRKVLVFSESAVAHIRNQREKDLALRKKKQPSTTSSRLPALDEQKKVMERIGALVLAAIREVSKEKDTEIAQLREAKGELKGENIQLEKRLDDWKEQVEKSVQRSVVQVKESLKESHRSELVAEIKRTRWKASVVTFGVTLFAIGAILIFLATRT